MTSNSKSLIWSAMELRRDWYWLKRTAEGLRLARWYNLMHCFCKSHIFRDNKFLVIGMGSFSSKRLLKTWRVVNVVWFTCSVIWGRISDSYIGRLGSGNTAGSIRWEKKDRRGKVQIYRFCSSAGGNLFIDEVVRSIFIYIFQVSRYNWSWQQWGSINVVN